MWVLLHRSCRTHTVLPRQHNAQLLVDKHGRMDITAWLLRATMRTTPAPLKPAFERAATFARTARHASAYLSHRALLPSILLPHAWLQKRTTRQTVCVPYTPATPHTATLQAHSYTFIHSCVTRRLRGRIGMTPRFHGSTPGSQRLLTDVFNTSCRSHLPLPGWTVWRCDTVSGQARAFTNLCLRFGGWTVTGRLCRLRMPHHHGLQATGGVDEA